STGAITGTPTATGSFAFTLKVVDATGASAFTACAASCATPAAWPFNAPVGPAGASHAFATNGITITAYAYNNNGTPATLYIKNSGGTEQGLGIASDPDYEIDTQHFVQLDLTNVYNAGGGNPQLW